MDAWIVQCKEDLNQLKQSAVDLAHYLKEWLAWLICGKPILESGKTRYAGVPAFELYHCLRPEEDGYLSYQLEDGPMAHLYLNRDSASLGRSNRADFTVENDSVDREHADFTRIKGQNGRFQYFVKNISRHHEILIYNNCGVLLDKLPPNSPPDSPGHKLNPGDVVVLGNLRVTFQRREPKTENIGIPFEETPQETAESLLDSAEARLEKLDIRLEALESRLGGKEKVSLPVGRRTSRESEGV